MLSASVVVSCYNQEHYIKECLDSILSQDISFECEIIVSDDCSTDRTQEILREYYKNNKDRIKLILREKNVGPALNYHGLHRMASGDIVFHFDGDDVMLPGKLASQYDKFIHDETVNVVFHKAIYFSDDNSYLSETQFPGVQGKPFFEVSLKELSRWGTIAVHSSYAYRKISRKTVVDTDFMEWFFAMDSLLPNGKAIYINSPLVKYRCNISEGSYLSTRSGKIKAYLIYFNDVRNYFKMYPELRFDLYANFLVTSLAMLRSTRKITLKNMMFLLFNSYYFRPTKVMSAISVRRLVGPKVKIR